MDDSQRAPRDGDRRPVRDRIRRAVAQGRISSADGDIRLANVDSAQSMSELDLMVRDLDQLEAVLGPGTAAAPQPTVGAGAPTAVPGTPSGPTSFGPDVRSTPSRSAPGTGRRVGPVLVAVLALVLVGAGGAAFFALGSSGGSETSGTTGPVLPGPADPRTSTSTSAPSSTGSHGAGGTRPAAAYSLTAAGVRAFLATYRQRFGTSRVVDLTLYGDYVIVRVPVAGKPRSTGWMYRDGEFSDFGGTSANFPGSQVVDTSKLDIGALVRNIVRARASLHVEDYTSTYVTINYRPQFDEVPNVNIYVSNDFHESGYLATTLNGSVERSYPYTS